MFVYNNTTQILYESYATNVVNGVVTSRCGVIWNMSPDFTYGPTLRDNPTSQVGSGDQCTSADAAGLPMSPFMVSADDIARGSIDHAMRLTLPNSQIRASVFVRPAVHIGGPSAPAASLAPPYGTRFRLKASFNISGFSAGGQVVAKALQKYGMIIADGGDHCLSAVTDTYTVHKWSDSNVNLKAINSDLLNLSPSDFEIVDAGSPISATFKCRRTPLTN
jgi:serine/threonine-protein kinase